MPMYWLQPWRHLMIIQNQQEPSRSRGDQREQEHHCSLRNDGLRHPKDRWIGAVKISKGKNRT